MKPSLILLFLFTLTGSLFSQGLKTPTWISNPTQNDYKNCAMGIGRSTAIYPKEEALMMALMEQGFRESSVIKSMFSNYAQEDGGEAVSSQVVKLKSQSSASKMHQKELWVKPDGSVYTLLCRDEKGISYQSQPTLLKYFLQYTKAGTKEKAEAVISFSIKDYIDFKDIPAVTLKTPQKNERQPQWVLNPYLNGEMSDLGSAKIYNGNIQEAYIVAMMQARVALAGQIQSKVNEMVKSYKKSTGDGSAPEKLKSTVTKMVTSQTLVGSYLLKYWHDTINNEIFVLVGLDANTLNKTTKSAVKSSLENDKALWQQFQAKQKK